MQGKTLSTFKLKCSEDIEDISRLQSKLQLPSTPPDPSTISSDIKKLHYTIGARYVGGASLIKMKTPEEGFAQQATLLKKVRTGFERQARWTQSSWWGENSRPSSNQVHATLQTLEDMAQVKIEYDE